MFGGTVMGMSFFKNYRKTIITSVIGVVIVGAIPSVSWVHNVWADGKYVQHESMTIKQISDIDDTLYEIDQDIVEAAAEDDPGLKAKLKARKQYYQRKKEALRKELNND